MFMLDCAGLILVLALLAVIAHKSDLGNYRRVKDTARLTFLTYVVSFLVFLSTSIPYSVAMTQNLLCTLGTGIPSTAANLSLHLLPSRLTTGPVRI